MYSEHDNPTHVRTNPGQYEEKVFQLQAEYELEI